MMKFVYWRLNNVTELSVVADGNDGDGLHFEKFAGFSQPSSRQNQ